MSCSGILVLSTPLLVGLGSTRETVIEFQKGRVASRVLFGAQHGTVCVIRSYEHEISNLDPSHPRTIMIYHTSLMHDDESSSCHTFLLWASHNDGQKARSCRTRRNLTLK